MRRKLPGLGALKTFEAAAHHQSFARAADELGVTPAAVSHLVRELEDQLQLKLFQRSSRVVRLTHDGEILHAAVTDALDRIGDAIARLRSANGKPRLVVTTTPSFATKWLVPRLDRFLSQFPDADVRIDISERLVDLARDEADIGIRFGTGNYPGLRVDRLFHETVFPVCSPKLLKDPHRLRQPRDLRHHTLLHVDWQMLGEAWPSWQMWMRAAGVEDVDTTRGIHFEHTSFAIQAAIDGQGVALGDASLVVDDLAAGRLVRPFDLTLKASLQFAYYLVSLESAAERPVIKAFRDWILAEAARMGPSAPSNAPEAPRRRRTVQSGKHPARRKSAR
jgi:LysR family transcriptional regulator, glycine cleavage system transcriptional activator